MTSKIVTAVELLGREIIRPNQSTERRKRMTEFEEEECSQKFFMDAMKELIDEGINPKYPELNARVLAKEIDADIIFDLLLIGDLKIENNGNNTNKHEVNTEPE